MDGGRSHTYVFRVQRRWVAGNEPFASFCVRRHGDGRTHAKAGKHPLARQSDKMDYQTKKAREGDPVGPYLSHLTR